MRWLRRATAAADVARKKKFLRRGHSFVSRPYPHWRKRHSFPKFRPSRRLRRPDPTFPASLYFKFLDPPLFLTSQMHYTVCTAFKYDVNSISEILLIQINLFIQIVLCVFVRCLFVV